MGFPDGGREFAKKSAPSAASPENVKLQGQDDVGCQRSLPEEAALTPHLITTFLALLDAASCIGLWVLAL